MPFFQKHLLRCLRALLSGALPLTLLPAVAFCQPASAQKTPGQSIFPLACAVLPAELAAAGGEGPASEDRRDTARIQAALNACPAGQSVELAARPGLNAFLIGPITVPAGVTLVVDAGVTVFASSDPTLFATGLPSAEAPCGGACRALITAQPGTAFKPGTAARLTGVMGFGVIDGRGGHPLLESAGYSRTWYDLPAAVRPALLAAADGFSLYKITLRRAAADALRFTGTARLTVVDVKVVSDAVAGTRGLVLAETSSQMTTADQILLSDSTLSGGAENLWLSPGSSPNLAGHVTLNHVSLYDGLGLIPAASGHNHCVADSAPALACLPAVLPAYAAELLATVGATTNLQKATLGSQTVTLTAVITATSASEPEARQTISFFDNGRLIGSAHPVAGVASLSVAGLSSGEHHLTASSQDTGAAFGQVQIESPAALRADADNAAASARPAAATAVTLASDFTQAPRNTNLHLTASMAAGVSGMVTFYDGSSPLATAPVTANGTATLTLDTLAQGQHSLTASLNQTGASQSGTSPALSVTIVGVPTSFTLYSDKTQLFTNQTLYLTAEGLPVDAGGTLNFIDNGQPAGTVTLTGSTQPGIVSFGDSITAGSLLTDVTAAYPQRLGADLSGATANHAIPGTTSCDMMLMEVFPANSGPTQGSTPLSTLMVGTNDAYTLNNEQAYRTCHQATLAWLSIPRDQKVLAGDPAVQQLSGSWLFSGAFSNDNTYRTLYNTSGSGAARFPVHTNGQPLYLWYLLDDQHTGTFTVAIDGVSDGTVYSVQLPFGSDGSKKMGMGLLRFPVAAGDHTLDATIVNGNAGFLGVGTAPASTSAHPTVLSGDLPFQRQGDPHFPEAVLDQLNADAQADVQLLAGDGLDIRFIPTRSFFFGDPAAMTDQVHPNALGQQQIESAFLNVLGSSSLIPYRTFTGSLPTEALLLQTPGTHSVVATYSGDANYAPTTSAPFSIVMQSSVTATTLAVTANDLPAATPVTLTASVQPAAATGTVQFLDLDGGTVGVVAVAGGGASLTATLPVGRHRIQANFNSNEGRDYSSSTVQQIVIEPPPATVLLGLTPASAPYGQNPVLMATVAPASATGSVTFSSPAYGVLGTATVQNGVASIIVPVLPAGTYPVTAAYLGDAANGPASSPAQTLQMTQAQPLLQLPTATLTAVFGTSVSVRADLLTPATPALPASPTHFSTSLNATLAAFGDTIIARWPLPTHNLGNLNQTSANLLALFGSQVVNQAQSAGYERVLILAGTSDILFTAADTATILANIDGMARQASAAGLRVILATLPPITYQGVSRNDRVNALNAAIKTYAQQNGFLLVDFNAAFLASARSTQGDGVQPDPEGYALMETQLADSLLLPGGSVSLPDGTAATLSASGIALLSTSSLPAGQQTLTVSYAGDRNFAAATAPVTVSISKAVTATTLTVQPLAQPTGTAALLTVTVSGTPINALTGSVELLENGHAIGSAALDSTHTAQFTTPILSGGNHAITALYAGDGNFNQSTSAATNLNVRYAQATLVLSAANTSFDFGSPVTVTATLTGSSPTGTLQLYDGSQMLLEQAVSGTVNTLAVPQMTVGQHPLSVRYSGDTYNSPATSQQLTLTIVPAATTLALAPLTSPVSYGTAVTLAATLTSNAANATGAVTFTETTQAGVQTAGQAQLAGGSASLNLPALAVGTHTFAASYAGDATHAATSAVAVSVTVNALASSTTLVAAPVTVDFGGSTVLSLTVLPATATGSVTLTDSLTGISTQLSLSGGKAAYTAASLSTGTHTFTAAYAGDATTSASRSANLQVLVQPVASTLTLDTPPASLTIGSALTLSASVQPASASGTITFRDSKAGTLGQATLASGRASLTLASLPVGSYSITASYSGDTNDNASTSQPVSTQVVLIGSATTISATPLNAPFGTEVTMTATVTASGSNASAAQGTVIFSDSNGQALGSALLQGGTASLQLTTLTLGAHGVHASFAGDTTHAGSDSGSVSLMVTPDNTVTTMSMAQNPLPAGLAAIFNVQVTGAAQVTPTGLVTLRSGSRTMGTATLSHGQNGTAYATLQVDSAAFGIGSFPVVAFYAGDSVSSLSNSAGTPTTLEIQADAAVAALNLSNSHVPVQTATEVAAAVTSPASGLVPTGSVTFLLNGTPFASATLDGAGLGRATLPAQAIGTYTVSATYTPSGFFAAATMLPRTLTVTPPLTLAFAQTTVSAQPGSTSDAALTITPLSNFAGAISAQCSTPVTFLTCSVDAPASVNASPAQATVHLTVPKSLAMLGSEQTQSNTMPIVAALLGGLLLPLTAGRRRLRSARLLVLLFAVALAGLASGLTGCGTGGNFFSIPTGQRLVTVTVTAAGVATQAQVEVNITQ